MSNTVEVPHDVNTTITELKSEVKSLENRVNILERTTDRHDQQIIAVNTQLNKIEENTTWIKRTITAAIITATSTGVIGGAAGLFWMFIRQ